ncbi:hypothetical protein TNCV_4444031 [Trichonephila clavipes]|nr:hypothetical protein TNCV_4444031 [Trichonephila clavipes]
MLFPVVFSEEQGISDISTDSTCDDSHPHTDLGLPPYTIINQSFKRQQSIEPVCAIVSHAHLFQVIVRMSTVDIGQRLICTVYLRVVGGAHTFV